MCKLLMKCEMDIEHLEIIVGTYEEFLLGYKILLQEDEELELKYTLVQSFANHSHRASVRSVAAGGKFLASGGADESILLYDMVSRKEAGLLMQHHGNVNCLEFSPNGSHLLSGSEDGTIGACRTGSWQLEKFWGSAHKGSAVTSLSIHPSGKLFLSVGTDATLKTWNLVKGRAAYATNLCKIKDGRSVTQVLWSPDGESYAVVIGTRVEIFTVAAASIIHTIEVGKKVTCTCFVEANLLFVATEEGDVLQHDLETKTELGQFKPHGGQRIRCMTTYGTKWVVTASSSGEIKLWQRKNRIAVTEYGATNIGCRITCLTVITSTPTKQESKELLMTAALDLAETDPVVTPKKRPIGVVTVEDSQQTIVKSDGAIKRKRRQKRVVQQEQARAADSSSSDEESVKVKVTRKQKKRNIKTVVEDASSEDESEASNIKPVRKKKKNNSNIGSKKFEEVVLDNSASGGEPEEVVAEVKNKSRHSETNTKQNMSKNERRKTKKEPVVDIELLGAKRGMKKLQKSGSSKRKSSSGTWALE